MNLTPEILSQLLNYPIQQPPPGVKANFVNPDSTAYQIYITAGVCIPLMLAFSIFRLITGLRYGRKTFVADEIVFVIGLALCLAFIAMDVACVSGGAFGRHAWDVLLGSFTKSQLVLSLLVEIFAPLAICAIKVSVMLLYLRVFGGRLRWMRNACIVGIVVSISYHASLAIAFGAMCAPSPSMGYSQLDFLAALVSDSCGRSRVLVVIQGVGNVVLDFFLLLLPLPAIWNLQMPFKRKINTSAMFLIGICACISSLIGLAYRVKYFSAGADNTRLSVATGAATMAEMAAGVVICCGPPAAMIYRSAKEPVLSWLSTIRLPLVTSSRSSPRSGRSQSNVPSMPSISRTRPGGIQHMSSEPQLPKVRTSGWFDSATRGSGASIEDQHDAWTETEADTYSLRPLNPTHEGIEKTTKFSVARTEY